MNDWVLPVETPPPQILKARAGYLYARFAVYLGGMLAACKKYCGWFTSESASDAPPQRRSRWELSRFKDEMEEEQFSTCKPSQNSEIWPLANFIGTSNVHQGNAAFTYEY